MKYIKLFEELHIKKDTNTRIKELILKFLYLNPGKNSTGSVEGYVMKKIFGYGHTYNTTFKYCIEQLVKSGQISQFEEKATEYLELVKQ